MKEAMTAKIYAQSLYELGNEDNHDITAEMTSLTELINSSNDLENALFLDIFTTEEKSSVFSDIVEKLKLSKLVSNTVNFLIEEKRLGLLPLIFKEMVVLDDDKKGFLRSSVEGSSDSIEDSVKEKVKAFLKSKTGKEPIIEYIKNEEITAGYKITAGDLQLDATVDSQLEKLKENIFS